MKVFAACAWRTCVIVVACGVLAAPGVLRAQDLTLRDAVELASARNPELAALHPALRSLQERVAGNVLAPAIALEVQVENFAGSGDASGTQVLEATLQLSRVVELGGKRAARERVGNFEVENLSAEHLMLRADIVAELARRFIHVLSDQAQLDALRRATTLAAQTRDAAQARLKEGASSPTLLSRAEIAFTRATIEQEHAEHELASSRVALAVMWGDVQPQFAAASGDLFALPVIEPLDAYVARLPSNPDLLSFATRARLLEARERLAESQRRPNITMSAGVRRLEAFDEQALVAGFAIPLGASSRAQSEIRAVRAQRDQLHLTEQARRLDLHATLFGLYQEILHARTEAQALHEHMRPQAQRMVSETERGYRAGRFSLLELVDAQRQLLDIERDAIRAAAAHHVHLIEIERLTGVALHALAKGK